LVGQFWQFAVKNPLDGNNSKIPNSERSLPLKNTFKKCKIGNVTKMKNKPDPAKSRETFSLRMDFLLQKMVTIGNSGL
jgi:hypothetical protein